MHDCGEASTLHAYLHAVLITIRGMQVESTKYLGWGLKIQAPLHVENISCEKSLPQEKWYINTDPFLHCIYTVLLISAQCKYSTKTGQYLYTTFPVYSIAIATLVQLLN